MTVYRRVVNREVDDTTATETLECGHTNTLYRRVEGHRGTWRNRQGAPTNLSAVSRECPDCEKRG